MTFKLTSRRVRSLLASAAVLACANIGLAAFGPEPEEPTNLQDVSPLFLFQNTQPATGPVAQEMKVTVTQLMGVVTVSLDNGKKWKRVAEGDVVGPGATFRTGLRSAVTCKVGTDQQFTLESLSTLRVEEALRTGGKEKTDLLMKYGAASYGIEAAGREYDSVIRTPGSTMAIRGTVVRVYDRSGFAPQAESYTGRALFRTARGTTFIGGRGYSVASAVQGSAAETALSNSTVDPSIASARTAAESTVVSQQLSQGGVLGFDTKANIPVIRNGSPLPDSSLPGALPGRLSFALRWTGNADLNFIVDNQAGNQDKIILAGFQPTEILFPGYGLNVSNSGGLIPFDNRGGPKGGTEIAYWKDSFPIGVYGVGVLHASGADAAFKINAFLDGKPLPIFAFDEEGNLIRENTFTGTVGKNDGDGAILFVPRNPGFEEVATPVGDETTQEAAARAILALQAASAKQTKTKSLKPTAAASVAAANQAKLPKLNKAQKYKEAMGPQAK